MIQKKCQAKHTVELFELLSQCWKNKIKSLFDRNRND